MKTFVVLFGILIVWVLSAKADDEDLFNQGVALSIWLNAQQQSVEQRQAAENIAAQIVCQRCVQAQQAAGFDVRAAYLICFGECQ